MKNNTFILLMIICLCLLFSYAVYAEYKHKQILILNKQIELEKAKQHTKNLENISRNTLEAIKESKGD